jgi:hypothetical protein
MARNREKMVKLVAVGRKLPNDVLHRQIRYKVGQQYNLQMKVTNSAESSFSTHLFRGRYISNYPVAAAARLLGLRVRILPGAWLPVSCSVLCVVRYRYPSRADH